MLLKQSWPQVGKADSPGTAVPVVATHDDEEEVDVKEVKVFETDDEEVGVKWDVVFEIDADEVEVEEELVVESDDGIEALDTLVVKPSKAFA